jgi:hypothetical protein
VKWGPGELTSVINSCIISCSLLPYYHVVLLCLCHVHVVSLPIVMSSCAGWALHFWIWFSFYFWIFSAMIISIVFLLVSFSVLSANIVSTRISSTSSTSGQEVKATRLSSFLNDEFAILMRKSIYKIAGYPIIMLVCWGPSLLYDSTESSGSNRAVDVCNFFFPGLQGLLVTLVYVITNREAKSYVQGK